MGSEGFSECAFNVLLSKNSQMMVGEEDESFTQNFIEDILSEFIMVNYQ
jgi:hypothetical protein